MHYLKKTKEIIIKRIRLGIAGQASQAQHLA
jgi:hypothetical protein